IVGDRNSNWPSPDLRVVGDKSGEKVLVFSRWRPIFEANSDDFVAGTLGSIPGSVFRGETVAVIFRWKHDAVVKYQAKGCRMSLDENVGNGDLLLQIGALS